MLARNAFLFLGLALLSACAAQAPDERDIERQKLASLSDSTARLKSQYIAMGETLSLQEKAIDSLRTALLAPTPLTPQTQESEKNKAISIEQPRSAEIGDLTEQDLQPHSSAQIHQTPKATSEKGLFYVHVASYATQGAAQKGWSELKKANSSALSPSGFSTEFTDSHGKNWARVLSGPYESPIKATSECVLIKKKGSWCEVLNLSDSQVTKLP